MSQVVTFRFRNRWETGEVVKENRKTVWVRLTTGDMIQRHKVKHGVEPVGGKKP